MRTGLLLFTGDLRVHDQPALAAAGAECELVVPAFVLDEQLLAGGCGAPNRVSYLLDSLRDLDASLRERGAGLVLRRGETVEQAIRLARRFHAEAIYLSADVTPFAKSREQRLAEACERERLELRVLPGGSIVPAGALKPTGGDHYRVFTPYWRAWSAQPLAPAAPTPRRLRAPAKLPAARLPALRTLTSGKPSPGLRAGGESEARKRLDAWLRGPIERYGERHDDLAGAATSHISADLHFGLLSPRAVLERARARDRSGDFVRQLCWRDFHRQVLAARPDIPHSDYRPRGDRWRRDRRGIEAWRAGRTGYPIVDAGMRQLAEEGFMHNRARMIVASFLTKLLYVDWRTGAAHFASLLADADVANNVGNWQWVAGTGNDTRPNRVLNPLRQSQRFDRDGAYLRRYVPELAGLQGAEAHEPWRLAAKRRRELDYPAPILDHAAAAAELRRRRG